MLTIGTSDLPALGVVPEYMYASVIRPDRYGSPETACGSQAPLGRIRGHTLMECFA